LAIGHSAEAGRNGAKKVGIMAENFHPPGNDYPVYFPAGKRGK
jgi:hypothetical protein